MVPREAASRRRSSPAMKVTELPLPEEFTAFLNSQGFVDLYPPQAAAVEAGLLEGKSLLIACPTASAARRSSRRSQPTRR